MEENIEYNKNDAYHESMIRFIFAVGKIGAIQSDIDSLRNMDRDKVLQQIRDMLLSDDLEFRDVAIKALFNIDPYNGVDIILYSLHDPLASWRWYICSALAYFGDVRAIPSLINVVMNDDDDETRYMAAFALEKIGDNSALSALQHVMQNDSGVDYENRKVAAMAEEAIQSIIQRQDREKG